MLERIFPYVTAFVGAMIATLILTPLVRRVNIRLGMVDKPDERRINKVPIPRGGGLAIVLGLLISYGAFLWFTGLPGIAGVSNAVFVRMAILAVSIALLGIVDDYLSLPPIIKLLGQIVIAFLVWWWAGLGYVDLWPDLPTWIDCLVTVFWIVGAINAFNLIDGIDGLASGIGFVAVLGMAGSVFYSNVGCSIFLYLAFAGALLGFLRYNYNPASIFLGDCGSMFIGFMISILPLVTHTKNSFFVSVGMPLLAMGVPIFDTTLAILRRSLRRFIYRDDDASGQVMHADVDHLHHRILRMTGLDQRKTAWILYMLTIVAVGVGLVAMTMQSKATGLWLAAVTIASVVIFKDSSIELFDAGRVLNQVAHTHDRATRRKIAAATVPFYIVVDLLLLAGAYFICCRIFRFSQSEHTLRSYLMIRVFSVFVFLCIFKVYRTVWSRAVGSNFVRLIVACVFGTIFGTVFIYYWPSTVSSRLFAYSVVYMAISSLLLVSVRVFRVFVRDLFYAIDCARLRSDPNVSRILVYGGGLRYKTFRRELVRTTSANDRMIVGILDDDENMRGRYIGGIRIYGTIRDAPEIIKKLKVDSVVIACVIDERLLRVVKAMLAKTGVKVTMFSFSETRLV